MVEVDEEFAWLKAEIGSGRPATAGADRQLT
jgi:hypothetical protein